MISLRDRFIAYTVLLLGAVVALYPLWSIFNLSISKTKRIRNLILIFLVSILVIMSKHGIEVLLIGLYYLVCLYQPPLFL